MTVATPALEAVPQTLGEAGVAEHSLRDFVDTVVEPNDQEWLAAWRRLAVISHEAPVIALCDKLVEADALEVVLHQSQVTVTADIMGQRDGLSTQHLEQLNRAGQVHDVGKADPEILAWTRSSERYQGERLQAFLAVIGKHSDLGVDMILAEDSPYSGRRDVDGIGSYALGWDADEREVLAGLVWGHHTFKAQREQRYGVQPSAGDPIFPAARDLAIADMACAMAEGRKVRAYKDALPRDVIRDELHSGSSVASARIDRLLYGDAQPDGAVNGTQPDCDPVRRRRANIGRNILSSQPVRLTAVT